MKANFTMSYQEINKALKMKAIMAIGF